MLSWSWQGQFFPIKWQLAVEKLLKQTQKLLQLVQQPNVVAALRGSPFWSIMADKLTDSTTKQVIITIYKEIIRNCF